jgi:hypothetical protein
MDRDQEIIKDLSDIFNKNGFVTSDEILKECEKFTVSDVELVKLYPKILSAGIVIGNKPIQPVQSSQINQVLPQSTNTNNDQLVQLMTDKGLQCVDKREKGGALWVIGGEELKSFFTEVKEKTGVRFSFCAKGGRASQHQPAWFGKK